MSGNAVSVNENAFVVMEIVLVSENDVQMQMETSFVFDSLTHYHEMEKVLWNSQ